MTHFIRISQMIKGDRLTCIYTRPAKHIKHSYFQSIIHKKSIKMNKLEQKQFKGIKSKIEILMSELNQTLDLYYENIIESDFESNEKVS